MTKSERLDLAGHYMALQLLVFVKSGLFEALIDLIGSSSAEVVDRATSLIGYLIDLCNQLLPEHLAVEVQSLPGLFDLASQFRQQEQVRHLFGAKSREYTKWDWAIVCELLQGPLLAPRRLEETLRTTKFFKRLCSFYRPSKRLFCDLPINKANGWIRRLEKTLTMGYFTMVGSMAKHDAGVFLLGHFRFFTLFYHLSEITARPDIMRVLIVSLDYSKYVWEFYQHSID
ncbi:hypothetical protein H9P43_009509 [Blastocladiella emersonii ATCC 22665]|nr:hypothetical protein H9P43_009509 [Blastocladiella emersonii ATCC 22665]